MELTHPQVSLARDQGKSPPSVHKARVDGKLDQARYDIDTYSLVFKLMQPGSEEVGSMNPFQGPTPITGKK